MMDYISFSKLDQKNPYYEIKKNNYYNLINSYKNKDSFLKTYPARLTVQTTERCNLACIMCNINRPNEHAVDMNIDIFKKLAIEVLPYIIEFHPTNIGEPLCSPWFNEMCNILKRYGVLLDLTTNGMLLKHDIIDTIIPILKDIKISFDGSKKETLEKIRKGAHYDKVIRNINAIIKSRKRMEPSQEPTITLQMTLMKSNINELLDAIHLAYELGVDRLKAYHLFSYDPDMDKEIAIGDEYQRIHKQAIEYGSKLDLSLEIAEPMLIDESKEKELVSKLSIRACPLLWAEAFIDVNGEVYPCHSHGGDNGGSILSNDFHSIWNSEFYRSLRNGMHKQDPIWHCTGCGMNIQKDYEDQHVPYDFENFTSKRSYSSHDLRWSSRSKQFDILREWRDK
jgi:radical SAM protein with 4Fe4S-binding SPASM domain